MRVVSLVPSWTETLIEAGVDVVGRTRFCIHPKDKISSIPAVGGTKDWNFDKIQSLKPDFLILDQEENPKFMAEQSDIPYLATHITSVKDVPAALFKLSTDLKSPKLSDFAKQWTDVLGKPSLEKWQISQEIPGLHSWGKKPSTAIKRIIYVIWKNPWMVVSKDTFVGSVLSECGLGDYLEIYNKKYPEMDLSSLPDKESTLLLFSSEPYPFIKKPDGLSDLGCPYAFVDGENFSWFGVRSLRFLETIKS